MNELIAAMRNHLPALIAIAERAQRKHLSHCPCHPDIATCICKEDRP